MAPKVFKIGNIYHFRYQLNGKRQQKTTGETVKYKAQAIADADYEKAKLAARNLEAIPTLKELTAAWLNHNEKLVSENHIKAVSNFYRLHLYDLGDIKITEINTEKVDQVLIKRLDHYSRASVNQWLAIIRLLFNWALKRGVINQVPFNNRPLKLQKKPRPTLSLNQSGLWFGALDNYDQGRRYISLAARLMFGLGLRESEAITARYEWVDWDRATYTPGITKGREAEAMPMPVWLLNYLLQDKKPAGLMVSLNNQKARPGFTRAAFDYANQAIGVKGITPHRLRGSYATLLSEEGLPIQTIQQLLRHKDYRTTFKYVEKNLELATRAQKAIGEKSGLLLANGLF